MKSLSIDTTKKIAYVALRMQDMKIDGIQLYDESLNYILDYTWSQNPNGGKWTDIRHIPDDHQIIGLKCNASEQEWDHALTTFSLITGPIIT